MLMLALAVGDVSGQRPGDPVARALIEADTVSLSGEVLDAASGEPLAGATLTLRSLSAEAGTEPRTTLTDEGGRYTFRRVRSGEYALQVDRAAYTPVELTIRVGSGRDARIAVALEIAPILLDPVDVSGRIAAPYQRDMLTDGEGVGQAGAVRQRQERFLSSDVWSLTHHEVLRAVTLGEPDLLRALHRLPGVSTRDDWTAELWTRGSEWDHTRVYFDDLPLFNPVHGAGVLSGVNADAVEAVYLHPGVRSVALGEGASALQLVSRRGGAGGDVSGFGELSLASARLSVDGPLADGDGGWMVAARRSHIDVLAAAAERVFNVDDADVPYRFTDVTARVDHPLGRSAKLELSGLFAYDRLTGDLPDVVERSRLSWGNVALRATLEVPLLGTVLRQTFGLTQYRVDADTTSIVANPEFNAPAVTPMDHRLQYWLARGVVGGSDPRRRWSGGYELVHQRMHAAGATPPHYLQFRSVTDDSLARRDAMTTLAAWYERRAELGPVRLEAGLRGEVGTEVSNLPRLRLAPRVIARVQAAPGVLLSAGVTRAWQHSQALVPVGAFRADFPSGYLWLLAGDDVPALRSDLASVGGEVWISDTWLASASAYLKSSSGVLMPDPSPGITLGRPLFVVAEEQGSGVEVALRRLEGRLTGSLALTLAQTEHSVGRLAFPTRTDRPYQLDFTARYRLTGGLHLGGAYTRMAGAPYTRVIFLHVDPETGHEVGALAEPNSARTAPYASLDLVLDWTKRFDDWQLGGFIQVRNALARSNVANYTGTNAYCESGGYTNTPMGLRCLPNETVPEQRDEYLLAAPPMPLIGFRIAF